jgi:hypothetical protein
MHLSQMASALLVVAGLTLSQAAAQPVSLASRLDGLVEARLAEAKLKPGPLASDAEFLRRVWLDLAGTLPSADRVSAFLADKAPDKRARLVEEILAGDAYVEHWARMLLDTFVGQRPVATGNNDNRVLYDYLVDALGEGRSYRAIVRELLTGEGVAQENGPANFTLRYNTDPNELAGATARVFLGVSLRCAQCHKHPFEKWTQDDFQGYAAFFSRLRAFATVNDGLMGIVELRKGELEIPDPKGALDANGAVIMRTIAPRLPGGGGKVPAGKSRRKVLADWMTSADNPYFARNAVNRVWERLFGKGLVEPLDSLGKGPGPSAVLLDALAEEFVKCDFDLERLLRGIVLSRTYQRSSGPIPENMTAVPAEQQAKVHLDEERLLARFPIRALSVDQLYEAIATATGYRDEIRQPGDAEMVNDPAAEQLKDTGLSLQRSLALLNGPFVQQAVVKGVRQARIAAGRRIGAPHVERLFLSTLCRKPTPDETERLLRLMEAGEDRNKGLEDVLWVLLNSAEFTTNH